MVVLLGLDSAVAAWRPCRRDEDDAEVIVSETLQSKLLSMVSSTSSRDGSGSGYVGKCFRQP